MQQQSFHDEAGKGPPIHGRHCRLQMFGTLQGSTCTPRPPTLSDTLSTTQSPRGLQSSQMLNVYGFHFKNPKYDCWQMLLVGCVVVGSCLLLGHLNVTRYSTFLSFFGLDKSKQGTGTSGKARRLLQDLCMTCLQSGIFRESPATLKETRAQNRYIGGCRLRVGSRDPILCTPPPPPRASLIGRQKVGISTNATSYHQLKNSLHTSML